MECGEKKEKLITEKDEDDNAANAIRYSKVE